MGGLQCLGSIATGGDGGEVVHIRGSVQADTRMAMVAVIPIEEIPTEVSGLLNGAETSREFGTVLEGLELGFRVGIVVTDMRPRVTLPPKTGPS